MKKSLLACALLALTLTSCDSVKNAVGRSMDKEADLTYALDMVKERVKEKKVIRTTISGLPKELKNEMTSIIIVDVNAENVASQEIIPMNGGASNYTPANYLNGESQTEHRGDVAAIKGVDPEMLTPTYVLDVINKGKAYLQENHPDYKFEVVGEIEFDYEISSGETICEVVLCVTNPKDDKYTDQVYYEVEVKAKKDGTIEVE